MIDRWVCVSCDDCGQAEEILETAALARKAAKQSGWVVDQSPERFERRRSDYCPKCAAKRGLRPPSRGAEKP
jgi:hypothetical protein